jgi:hypothetical protein
MRLLKALETCITASYVIQGLVEINAEYDAAVVYKLFTVIPTWYLHSCCNMSDRFSVNLWYNAYSVAMLQIWARRYYCIIVITLGHLLKRRII